MRALCACRTALLGGHLDSCSSCSYERPSYNSCRNRHCPKCQGLAQAAWVEARMEKILPTHYFHLVFTLPQQLRPLAHRNRRLIFHLLFEAASETLLDLARDKHRLGALLGVTAVLHTWTRDMSFHPHLHCVVTGGGLSKDEADWVKAKGSRFLFPVQVLSALFRGKFLAGLVRLYKHGQLNLQGPCEALADPDVFQILKDTLYHKRWVVYAKRPFGGPRQVFAYLGHYTHRVAISNHRLLAAGDDSVRFKTKYGKTASMRPEEFIRRFLLHVLPKGFVKIRHYGLLAATHAKAKLAIARGLLEPTADTPQAPPDTTNPEPTTSRDYRVQMLTTTGLDITRCPRCGLGLLVRRPLFQEARSPPPPPPP